VNAETFNSLHPVGTPVFAYPGIRPEHPVAIAYRKRANDGRTFGDSDPCKRLVTKTRTPAWELGHGEPVVSVDGYAGGIVLDHVDVVSESVWQAAKEAEALAAAVAAQGALPVPAGLNVSGTVCPVNPPGHGWQNGLTCRWCWGTRTAEEAIVSGLASRRGGDEESARRLLAAYRASVLAEVTG